MMFSFRFKSLNPHFHFEFTYEFVDAYRHLSAIVHSSLKIDFQGARIAFCGGLILVRESGERLVPQTRCTALD